MFRKSIRVVVFIATTLSSFFSAKPAFSQDLQLWTDGFLTAQFAAGLEYELNPGISKLLVEDGWRDIYVCNTVTWQPTGWFAADGSLELHYVKDPLGPDIYEVRAFIGQKLIFTRFLRAIHLEKPYFYIRVDQRFLWYPEDDTEDIKTRVRPRLGGRILINSDAMDAKTVYLPFFFEYFINLNGEAVERYADRNRLMVGVGYVFNTRWRAELDYYGNRSRNSAEDAFVKSEMAVQLQLKYYFQYQTL